MYKKMIKLMLFLPAVLIIVNCKSTPEPKKPIPAEVNESPLDIAANAAMQAKKQAVSKGADADYPQEFEYAGTLMDKAKNTLESGNENDAINLYDDARRIYETIILLKEASLLRSVIDKQGFAGKMPKEYEQAGKFYNEAIKNCKTSSKEALQRAQDCVSIYKQIKDNGFFVLMTIAKKQADEAKNNCDSIKAGKSKSEEYTKAEDDYRNADSYEKKADYENAFMLYQNSAKKFTMLYDSVLKKRNEAMKSIDTASKKHNASKKLALEADKEAPLPEGAEGFDDSEWSENGDLKNNNSTKGAE